MIGWREARRRTRPAGPHTFGIHPARTVLPPRLHIKRAAPGMWAWAVTRNGAHWRDDLACTWPEALAVGLAELEAATLAALAAQ